MVLKINRDDVEDSSRRFEQCVPPCLQAFEILVPTGMDRPIMEGGKCLTDHRTLFEMSRTVIVFLSS